MPATLLFRRVTDSDLESIGRKAFNQAILFQKGYQVPPGFIITSEMFERYHERLIRSQPVSFSDELIEELSESYESLSIDPDHQGANALLKTKKEFVSLRSSYLSEKGTQELPSITLLNVKGIEKVLEAIQIAFTSFASEDIVTHKASLGLENETMAIVVQKMIDSQKAGIAHSDKDGRILITACFGLGEAILSGKVFPDEYLVEKDPLDIVNVKIQDKKVKFVTDTVAEKTIKIPLDSKSHDQVLNNKEIIEIARLTKKIEAEFSAPQKVEWAIRNDRIYIIQSKPIQSTERVEMEINQEIEEKSPEMIDVYDKSPLEEDLAALDEIEAISEENDNPIKDIPKSETILAEEIEIIDDDSDDAGNQAEEIVEYNLFPIGVDESDKDDKKEATPGSKDDFFEPSEEPSPPAIEKYGDDVFEKSSVSDAPEIEEFDLEAVTEERPDEYPVIEGIDDEQGVENLQEDPSGVDDSMIEETPPVGSIFSSYKGSLQTDDDSSDDDEIVLRDEIEDRDEIGNTLKTKLMHAGGSLVVTCDMVIVAKLKQAYRDHFSKETRSFTQLITELQDARTIPMLEEIKEIHGMKSLFLEDMKDLSADDVAKAIKIADRFLEEF